jgi:hypothetical protein
MPTALTGKRLTEKILRGSNAGPRAKYNAATFGRV